MAKLKQQIYLSDEDYNTLITQGSITKGGRTITYDPENQEYLTPVVIEKPGIGAIDAPTSTTLTDEQIAEIGKGVMINSSFLGFDKILLLPWREGYATNKYGDFVGITYPAPSTGQEITVRGCYQISAASKVISVVFTYMETGYRGYNYSSITLSDINGKAIPAYPSATGTFVLKCIDGTLTWVAE